MQQTYSALQKTKVVKDFVRVNSEQRVEVSSTAFFLEFRKIFQKLSH